MTKCPTLTAFALLSPCFPAASGTPEGDCFLRQPVACSSLLSPVVTAPLWLAGVLVPRLRLSLLRPGTTAARRLAEGAASWLLGLTGRLPVVIQGWP